MIEKNELLSELLKLSASHQWVGNNLVLTVDVCDCADIMFCLIDNGLIEEDGINMTLFDEYIEFGNF